MAALLDYPVGEHEDLVGRPERPQPIGDNAHGSAPYKLGDGDP